VTTNPSLISKEGGLDFKRHIAAICELVKGDVSAEVTSLDTEGMLREGHEYARIAPNVIIKCPLTRDGLKATRQLSSENIRVNVTLCFSAAQAMLAAKAGASYISPFMGRLDDVGQNGLTVLTEIVEIYRNYDWKTEVLDSGERIEVDLVVVGVGVCPATGFLEGIQLHEDGGVYVDKHLLAADGVYAAGDIAYFPSLLTNERQRIEHWRTAQQQGRVAAHNMAGKAVEFDGVPFFWTRQFDAGLLYVGHAASWDEIIFKGDVASENFLAFYVKDDRVLAVAGMNRDREMAAIEELMRLDRMPSPAPLREGTVDFLELLGDDDTGDRLRRSATAHHVLSNP
jgi:TalC/MipB family fructose-6-phosphate aldolase